MTTREPTKEEEPKETGAYTITRRAWHDLHDMLRYMRPAFTATEEEFIERYITSLPGAKKDAFGNVLVQVGKSAIAWSCHTDTVHTHFGKQLIDYDHKKCQYTLHKDSKANCLGADDTAGVWLAREMVMAQVPGLYMFHRQEESGGKGSKWIAEHAKEVLDGIKAVIALDRRGNDSVITFQWGGRCCSDVFGNSLADTINHVQAELGLKFKLDTGGSFTDSASYIDLVGECTNLSVGYTGQHGSREDLDAFHLVKMFHAIRHMDQSRLVFKRKPGEKEYKRYESYYYGGRTTTWGGNRKVPGGCGYRKFFDNHWAYNYTPDVYYSGMQFGNVWKRCTEEEYKKRCKWIDKQIEKREKRAAKKKERENRRALVLVQNKPSFTTVPNMKYTRRVNGVEVPDNVYHMVKDYPAEIAVILGDMGFDMATLREEVLRVSLEQRNKDLNLEDTARLTH